MDKEIKAIADYALRVLPLDEAKLSDAYFYQSLPLCVIDAVYSIGVRYTSVQAVVDHYCGTFELQKVRDDRINIPATDKQESINSFCKQIENMCPNKLATTLFQNRQRTSSRGGILKAEAVQQFACVLKNHEIEYFQDVKKIANNASFEKSIQNIPGQKSGISLKYFWMLTGSENFIKPDRMVVRFVETALNCFSIPSTSQNIKEVEQLLRCACKDIETRYPNITPRLLDHEIWKYQRRQLNISKRFPCMRH